MAERKRAQDPPADCTVQYPALFNESITRGLDWEIMPLEPADYAVETSDGVRFHVRHSWLSRFRAREIQTQLEAQSRPVKLPVDSLLFEAIVIFMERTTERDDFSVWSSWSSRLHSYLDRLPNLLNAAHQLGFADLQRACKTVIVHHGTHDTVEQFAAAFNVPLMPHGQPQAPSARKLGAASFSTTTACSACKATLGMLSKYQCQCCGGAYCSRCCNFFEEIPEGARDQINQLAMPAQTSLGWMFGVTAAWWNGHSTGSQRVCYSCHDIISGK